MDPLRTAVWSDVIQQRYGCAVLESNKTATIKGPETGAVLDPIWNVMKIEIKGGSTFQ